MASEAKPSTSTTTAAAGSSTSGGAAGSVQYYPLYQRSSLGVALFEALDELLQSGHINPQLAMRVLNQFDRSASTTFSNQLRTKATARGHLRSYNLVDEVWTFVLTNATFKLENNAETLGPLPSKCKVVACKASTADSTSSR